MIRAAFILGLCALGGVATFQLIADAIALRGCEEVCIATHMGDN